MEEDGLCSAYSEEEEEEDSKHQLPQTEQDWSQETKASSQSQMRSIVDESMVAADRSNTVEGAQTSKVKLSTKTTVVAKSLSSRRTRPPGSFVICGGNAAPLYVTSQFVDPLFQLSHISYRVDQYLTSQGWLKLADKMSQNFTLKWVEVRQNVNFKTFKEGEQLVNRFPNIQLLTTKIGLLENLRSYCKLYK